MRVSLATIISFYFFSVILFSGIPEAMCQRPQAYDESLKVDTRLSSSENKPALVTVKDMRYRSFRDHTRVVVDLAGPVKYKEHLLKPDPELKTPQRLYLDLNSSHISPKIHSPIEIKDGLLQEARLGQHTKDTVRIVLDMGQTGGYKVFHLYDPFRIVVDVQRPEKITIHGRSPRLVQKTIKTEKRGVTKFLTDSLAPTRLEFSGYVASQGRLFFNDALFAGQKRNDGSFSLQPEFYCEWEGGSSVTLVPFARLDSPDPERSHFDVRELNYLYVGDSWELRFGVGKVFWGVAEFTHLVDIINQTDAVEEIDGEDKLGQPMIHLSIPRDWGIVDVFVLPYFRERTYPGKKGRLRTGLRIDTGQARFESSRKTHHMDFAIRYSDTIGNLDIGIYNFNGTSREPTLLMGFDNLEPVLIPYYEQINQTGLDAELVEGEWLLKLEAIYRAGQKNLYGREEEDFFGSVGGFEYTFVRLAGTYMDLGVLGEWAYDERGDDATTPSQNDVMFGLRLTVNDPASTSVLAGVSQDLDNSSRLFSIEASRRFGDHWKLSLEGRGFFDVPQDAPLLYSLRDDDYIQLELAYYF